jgi:hypothetical protein
VLLNTLEKLVKKMLARRLQFDGVAHNAFEPNQFGGVAQRSTEDAGIYLTHLVQAEQGLTDESCCVRHRSILSVAQPRSVVRRQEGVCTWWDSTTYRWDSFTSDPYVADMGVGQGSHVPLSVGALFDTDHEAIAVTSATSIFFYFFFIFFLFFFFFFFFKSTIYNAVLERSPRAHNTNSDVL